MVSVYVPAGYNLVDISNQLYTEKSTASNIKSKATRKNVLDALEKIIQHLRIFKQTPTNGLIVFCGNVSEVEGKEDLKIWSFEPPEKMNTKIYWCDQVFVLDPLREMISEKEVYGLIVLDSSEADIGLLYGKKITPVKHIDSLVAGKSIKGGMCVSEDSLMQLEDGKIIHIKDLSPNSKLLSYSFNNFKHHFTDNFKMFKKKSDTAYKLFFKEPSNDITLTGEHKVFIVTKKGIEEKYVDEVKEGDMLLTVSNVETKNNDDNSMTEELSQLMGYFLGDGTIDNNRTIFYDKDIQLLKVYKDIADKVTDKDTIINKKGNSYELRVYKKVFVDFLKSRFSKLSKKRSNKDIDDEILALPNKKLGLFVRGLFDAEGYVDKSYIGIRMTNENVIRKLHLILIRFNIVSSLNGPDKFRRYQIRITNPLYIRNFEKEIGFSSVRKMIKLQSILKEYKRGMSSRVPISGIFIRKLIEDNGFKKENFKKYSMFLSGRRNIGYPPFKNLLKDFEGKLSRSTMDMLQKICNSGLVGITVKNKTKISSDKFFYDLYVPGTNSFVVNGLVVHNSQRRYDRIREEALNEFFKELASIASDTFLKQKELKGIIIGGPGPIKDQFVKGEFLNYQLIPKIIGVKDIGYTGEHGFEELVQRSEDLLKEATVMKERQLLQKFLAELQKGGNVVYGYTQTIEALNMGVIETLLVSEGFDWVRVKLKCDNTHETEKDLPGSEIERQICEVCGQSLKVQDKDYLGELLAEKAQNFGTKVEIISTDTQEGAQFKQLGGIGGFLRYRLR